ncbi:hypothetical protein [Brevundimonas sp. R86498]|uniref:hypothetical protein n=1 Tax=Brevundimonas sp. R86498 TaxID=3093845 RepID=UPI0037C7BE35
MILGVGNARRIGPPTIAERIADPLRFAAIVTALLVVESAFVTWVKTWGDRLSSGGYLQMGCIIFALQLAVIVVFSLPGPGRGKSIALGVVGGILVAMVWFVVMPLVAASGAVIVPVRS